MTREGGLPAVVTAGEGTVTIDIWGRNFSPTSCDEWYPPASPSWPPCSGPFMSVVDPYLPDAVSDVTWLGLDHVRFKLTIPAGVGPMSVDVLMRNPVGGAGSCTDCIAIAQ